MSIIMLFKVKSLYFVVFSFSFVLCTVAGTLTHELGHITVAKSLGYKTALHYGSMNYGLTEKVTAVKRWLAFKKSWDKAKVPANKMYRNPEFRKIQDSFNFNRLAISFGGPGQTMLTGSIGLLLLLYRRKSIMENSMRLYDWLFVFLSLFWLREIFNLLVGLIFGIFHNSKLFGGDEAHISAMLGLPIPTIPIIFGALGLAVSVYIIFRIVPGNLRFNFIISGIIGGISGYILWLYILGPELMP